MSSEPAPPAVGDRHRAEVDKIARGKISAFVGTINDEGGYKARIYAGSVSMGESIAADYHGRFLIELIQNANDVHPDERTDGEIEVVFDKRGDQEGSLYIANRGAPFSFKNVDALCEMGLSSKPPGESIGNKGLGFRSVHHITDAPKIYSQAEVSGRLDRFGGYCFGFADETDLAALIDDPRHLELAKEDLPLFHVPRWLDDQPEAVLAFSRRGFATVIVLPLRSQDAAKDVRDEIEAIQGQTVPMLLFLARLRRLSIRVIEADGQEVLEFELTRQEQGLTGGATPMTIAELGAAGRYLITRRKVSEAAMIVAIKEGVSKKQLHTHWLKWKGQGEVALAVRLDRAVETPRLFTFLPMGEQAVAPLAGYLHGSFFPSANRMGLDGSVRLNAMLLDQATVLAAAAIGQLVDPEDSLAAGLDLKARARAVVDLLAWRRVKGLEAERNLPALVAAGVAKILGATHLAEARVIPVLELQQGDVSIGWRAPSDVRRWTYLLETFTADVAARHAAATRFWPLWPELGKRLDGLVAYLTQQIPGYAETPTPQERVELAVAVAESLAVNKRTAIARWTTYYTDLAQLLEKVGWALAGRKILLDNDGQLHAAMTAAVEPEGKVRRRRRAVVASIFSPPARRGAGSADDEQLKPPTDLAENFAFLSDRLDWHGDLSRARDFLHDAKLVLEFDRESILTQLSRVMRLEGRNKVLAVGLRWAFQIWRQPRETGRPIRLQPQHRFLVPTIEGPFIEANQAIFSESWPDETQGRLLQRFLNSGAIDSADLTAVSARRLADKTHYAFKGGRPELWTAFLSELGVQSGLRPVKKEIDHVGGWRLRDMSFCSALGISSEAASAWKADILAENPGAMELASNSEYRVRGDLWWLPGQGDLIGFGRERQEQYAQLIIAWLGQAAPISWEIEVHHYAFVRVDTRDWPTPLKSFLRSAAWIPADEASRHRKLMARACDIWLAADGAERFPSFLRRPALPVMRALERATAPQLEALRKRAGLRTLNAPDTLLEQARFLADQYAREGFEPYFERHWFNLYHPTWRLIASRLAQGQLDLTKQIAPPIVVARRGADPAVADLSPAAQGAGEILYVRDTLDETAASLIEASGRLFFDARATDPAPIGVLMKRLYGERVRLLSQIDYEMRTDGQSVGVGDVVPILQRCPRLKLMVAVALEALKGGEFQRLPADRHAVIVRLEHVLFQRAGKISFSIDGLEVDEEIEGKSAFSLKLASGQSIVVIRTAGAMGWAVIDEALSAICEAIEQPALEANLRGLLLWLSSAGEEVDGSPPLEAELDRLCDVLRLGRAARRAVRETLGARLERHAPWLKAILFMAGGSQAVDAFVSQETAAVQDVIQLRQIVSPWFDVLSLDPGRVLEACKMALSVAELRQSLNLDFERFNGALQAVGQKPDTYPDLHAGLVANFVRTNDLAIIDALRTAHAATLQGGLAAPRYAQAREAVRLLAPDPSWLVRYQDVPDVVLAAHVDAWLVKEGAPALNAKKADLEPLEEVRRVNGQQLKQFVGVAGPLVRAWCRGKGLSAWGGWSEADGGLTALRRLLDEAGIFEFRTLEEAAMIAWSASVGAWPSTMERTLDRVRLGVVERDLSEERRKAEAAAEALRKEQRSISFKGRPVDPEEVDWQALATELGQSLSRTLLKTPLNSPADLLPALKRLAKVPRAPGGPGGSGGAGGFPPSQKTDAIGRLGEIAVYHWLKQRLTQDIDAAWCSKNATPFTGREGSDSLGYDFEVNYRGQPWQIEVKASLGDPCAFEMGETEVRAGRAAARGRGVQYWIAYVSNLSQPSQARIDMLPNPMSEDGEAVLNLLGEGLRYGFRRP